MNMVVTGATRVIGRQAIPCMLAAGHEVAGLARSLLAPRWLRVRAELGIDTELRTSLIVGRRFW
jgi:nucleoside-diphosphate-sugar epimerase